MASPRTIGFCAAFVIASACATARADEGGERLLPEGWFLADDGPRPFGETHADGRAPARKEPHHLRAAVEVLTVLGVGEAYYWIRPELNQRDWDFPDGKTRLENFVPSFDTNMHVTNGVLHPMAGSLYYWAARVNGLGVGQSLAYSFAASAAFEFFGEYLEKASINDLIVTPLGGLAAGELWTHLGDYLGSAPRPRFGHELASYTLGLPNRMHRGTWAPARPMPADELGFSSYYWHRFELSLGTSSVSNDLGRASLLHDVDLGITLAAVPGFLRPGRFSLRFSDGEFTEGRVRMSLGGNGAQTWDLFFDADLFGRYEQDISPSREGWAWMFAFSNAYQFAERLRLGRYDAFALAHLAGPEVRFFRADGDALARFELATYPDFAVLQSQAWSEWRARFGQDGAKTALIDQGYYFALGWSVRARAAFEYRGLEVGARGFFGTYGSIDRWDRFQHQVTRDVHEADRLAEVEGYVAFAAPGSPLRVRIYGEHTTHTSDMPPLSIATWDRRYGASLGLRF